jgi:hypothetical protein
MQVSLNQNTLEIKKLVFIPGKLEVILKNKAREEFAT